MTGAPKRPGKNSAESLITGNKVSITMITADSIPSRKTIHDKQKGKKNVGMLYHVHPGSKIQHCYVYRVPE